MLLSKVFTYHFIQLKFLFLYYLLTYCSPFIKINIFYAIYSNYDFPSPSPLRSSSYDIYLLTLCVCFCPSKHLEVRGRHLRVVLTVYPLVSGSLLLRLSVLAAHTFTYTAISAAILYSSHGNLGSSCSAASAVTVSQERPQERTETYFKEISKCNFPGKNKYLLTLTPWRLRPKAKDVFSGFGTYLRCFDL